MSSIPHRLLALAALLATSWACGAAAPSSDRDASDDTDTTLVADQDSDTAVVFPSEDGWWGVLGTLSVAEGLVDAEGSTLRLSARNADDTCEVATTITATGTPLVPPSEAIAWFTLTLEPGLGENRCAWPGPTSILLGLGDTDPQLAPGAARLGVSLETVYGLYLGGAGPELIGVAGTEGQLEGTEMPATEAPLPDGLYTLHTLYGAPLVTTPLFGRRRPPALIGVVHLPPLPGAPGGPTSLGPALDRGLADVEALLAGGVDALIVENLGDAPFAKDDVDDITVAAMTRVVTAAVARAGDVPVGVNVLRNDALAALAVAAASGASFIRVNVLVGAMVTDQGVIEGKARAVAEARARWAPEVAVAADVLVKHAAPLAPTRLHDVARDTWTRGGADALILTGSGTGAPTDVADVDRARQAAPDAPVWLGSGLTPQGADAVRDRIDAAIVGTWLHADGRLDAPVDADRVRRMADALRG